MVPSLALMSQLRARPVGPQFAMAPGMRPMNAPGQAPPTGPGGPQGPANPGPNPGGSPLEQWMWAARNKGYNNYQRDNPQLPYFEEDRARLGGMMDGHSPWAGGEWAGNIQSLQDRANGVGPSVAQDAYRQASQDTTASLGSMARGSASPAAARQALLQQGRVGQGMAQGLASARTQEMIGAQNALTQALTSRDSLNQNAYLDILAKQLGLSRDQLGALGGNRDAAAARDAASKQASAAKWGAIAGGLGMVGGLF